LPAAPVCGTVLIVQLPKASNSMAARGEETMFARVTKYRMKPESIDAAKSKLNELKPQIMAMPGMKNFINVMKSDGSGYVVAVVDSEETSKANQATVEALWASFSDYLAEPPVAEGFDVLMNETKG
jgi:hypothetical protein